MKKKEEDKVRLNYDKAKIQHEIQKSIHIVYKYREPAKLSADRENTCAFWEFI